MNRSDGLMGLASMRTRTCPGPHFGAGTSLTSSTTAGSPQREQTTAFIGVASFRETHTYYMRRRLLRVVQLLQQAPRLGVLRVVAQGLFEFLAGKLPLLALQHRPCQ